ncbi:MAG TPA: cytidine deaminase [Terriglobales bacterium]|nr:cytidine deaminase [Terriglobales bacterium]
MKGASRQKEQLPIGQRRRMIRAARAAMRRAYAPYSRFHVGSAVLTERGTVHTGCNVENSSYGLTNCAEVNAIQSAITKEGAGMKIRAVVVVNSRNLPCAPCGACRQVIFEFGPDAVVLYTAAEGWKQRHISELLPDSFRL